MNKIIIKIAVIAFLSAFLTSCNSSEMLIQTDKSVCFQRIGSTELLDIANAASEIYENYQQVSSRSTDSFDATIELSQAEQKIAQICEPLTNEGMQIRDQLVQIHLEEPESLSLTQEELEAISNLTDDQLATLAMQINALVEQQEFMIQTEQLEIASNMYLDCALKALGLTADLEGLIKLGLSYYTKGYIGAITESTAEIISATVAKDLIAGLAKRYAGWIGVAVILYDFAKCVNAGQNS